MGKRIKTFGNGSYLEYDRGKFDKWCVYLAQPDGSRRPPRDMDYFNDLKALAEKYGAERVYQDYVRVYEMTGKQVSDQSLAAISRIAEGYGPDALKVDTVFSILYMAMIAEEQKRNTYLGKRIKRLGVHVLLLENRTVSDAANFMRGMGWREIDGLCSARGF